ncbi:MAG: zinc ribbon domain-containing protein, partial [Eubacteriales bacterium]
MICQNCQQSNHQDNTFCEHCGTRLAQETTESPQISTTPPDQAPPVEQVPSRPRRKSKAWIFLLIAVVAMAVGFWFGRSALLSGGGEISLYLKGGEIEGLRNGKTIALSSRLNTDEVEELSLFVATAGDLVFYPDRVENLAQGVTLYVRKTLQSEGEKIDSEISSYALHPDGSEMVYLKQGALYHYDMENKVKLASDVIHFTCDADLSRVVMLTEQCDLSLWSAENGVIKLDSEVETLHAVSDDLATLYYTKDGSLYRQTLPEEERTLLAEGIESSVWVAPNTGELYYLRATTVTHDLLEYVDDPHATSDFLATPPEELELPEPPEPPEWLYFDDQDQFDLALEEYELSLLDYDEMILELQATYDEQVRNFQAIALRDTLRESLANATLESTEYTLYHHDGNSETLVAQSVSLTHGMISSSAQPVMIFTAYHAASVFKIPLEEVHSASDVETMVSAALYSASEKHIAVGANATILAQNQGDLFSISPDGDLLYFLDQINESGVGELYQVSLAESTTPTSYDHDVCVEGGLTYLPDGQLCYFKEVEEGQGELYLGKNRVDFDVKISDLLVQPHRLIYISEWNSSKENGTLKVYEQENSTKIADDVTQFDTTPTDIIRYLKDYSNGKGELYSYQEG